MLSVYNKTEVYITFKPHNKSRLNTARIATCDVRLY